MKKFIYSFLGTLSGIWISFILFIILFFLFIAAIAGTSASTPVKVEPNSVLCLNLSGSVVDREASIDVLEQIYGDGITQIPLNAVVNAIERAKDDNKIKGLYLDCNGALAGLAQSQAIIDAISDFKKSGKWVIAYADNYTQGNYFIAASADSVFVNPIGMVDIHGLSATTLYFKNLLDKLGVEAQVVKVGTYKSAVEPFILTDMSDANREQQQHYLGRIWDCVSKSIAANRNLPLDSINSWADNFMFSRDTESYVSNRIVDGMRYRHEVETLLSTLADVDKPKLVDCIDYYNAEVLSNIKLKDEKNIAVLYALGDITEDGEDGISSERYVPEILDLAENDDIDGLILRVNSGGGSAFASEQIWDALEQFKRKSGKPFYVSMGDVAASGGYYISSGANKIYAEPLTLTGSIGIFGIIPNAENLMKDKLGINSATVSTNTGDFPGFLKPMGAEQRAAMQNYVNRGYKLFVKRCADGRGLPVDSIYNIAEGRVWDGVSALEHGLVDELGGLQKAVHDMAEELGCGDNYNIVEYPSLNQKWWEQVLRMSSGMETSLLKKELGSSWQYYQTLKSLDNMHPLQCRMDYVSIE